MPISNTANRAVAGQRASDSVGLPLRTQHAPQRLLGGGLADRAGDGDHLRIQALARGMCEID
jgi:hypothetical protein